VVRFEANKVAVVDSEGSILVGFAYELDGDYREALLLSRSHEFNEQDVALGLDQVHIERNDQIQSGYGGIERVVLSPEHVRVVLSGRTAESLGDKEFDISLSLTADEYDRLRQGLRLVFRGFDTPVETSS
jgi:hypothetical protein